MNIFKQEVNYVGLDGTPKKRVLNFVLTRQTLFTILEELGIKNVSDEAIEEYMLNILQNGDTYLLLNMIRRLVVRSFAVLDYENDIIDQSKETQAKFEQSLMFDTILNEFIKNPQSMVDFINGISNTIELDETEKKEQTELQKRFQEKLTIGNDEPTVKQQTVAAPDADRIKELERQIELLRGGQQ